MGCIDACGGRPDLGRLAGVGGAGNVARYCVLRSDHRNYAAKRECGRPCGCIRRGGKPDRVWPSRSCHVSFARHHLVRGRLHDDFADAFLQTRNAPDKHGVDSGADFATRYCSREAGCGAAHSGSSPVCAAGARANTEHRSQELAASVTIFSFTSSLRSWRNWQTHQLEGQKPLSLQLLFHQSKPLIQFDFTLGHVFADLCILNGIGRKTVTGDPANFAFWRRQTDESSHTKIVHAPYESDSIFVASWPGKYRAMQPCHASL